MLTIIWALIIFGLLITVHEFGHFIVAKLNNIKVEEFSIGMGPVIIGKKWGETYYSLRAFPIGGFNKMSGMEDSKDADPRGFNKKSVPQRMAVIAAGSIMNFLLAIVLFIIIFNMLGIPDNSNIIGRVIPDMPAYEAGLREGDKITAINDIKTDTWEEVTSIIHENPEQKLHFEIERDGKILNFDIVPKMDPEHEVGIIGIQNSIKKLGFFKSIWLGVTNSYEILKLILVSLVQMFTGQIAPEVAGPVGIVQMIGEMANYGLSNILSFAALLSLNLGLFNLLPIPALDGSRLIFLFVEWVRGKKLDVEKENLFHLVGFALLLTILIVVTYQDILRIFK